MFIHHIDCFMTFLQMLQVVYSYWDGSGHRKTLEVRKGTTIGRFLELVKQQLIPDFHEVRSTNPEDFVYVKEDLIIPHVSENVMVCFVNLTNL